MASRRPLGHRVWQTALRRDRGARRRGQRLGVEALEVRRLLTHETGCAPPGGIDQTVAPGGTISTLYENTCEFSVPLQAAIRRATDLSNHSAEELAAARRWVVRTEPGATDAQVAQAVGAVSEGDTGLIARTAVLEFPARVDGNAAAAALDAAAGVEFFYPLVPREYQPFFAPNDPLYPDQWHLNNTNQIPGQAGYDVNAQAVWDTVRGRGVLISVVDQGIQYTHPDLAAKYFADLDTDVVSDDDDPRPEQDEFHATAVAGVAAAQGNNKIGVSGSAPEALLTAVRLLGGFTDDQDTADAFTNALGAVDVSNNSWGAVLFYDALEPLSIAALEKGVTEGRDGNGIVYVFAGGNGLEEESNSNYRTYQTSRNTISVAAIGPDGEQTFYSEPGANLLVGAPSGDNREENDVGITTTDILGEDGYAPHLDWALEDYTNDFNGTSSASPLVAGVVALMLEANPELTYRDVMSILARTAEKNDPNDADWRNNGAGLHVNHKYGFGSVDAKAAVDLARTWKNLPPLVELTTGRVTVNAPIPDNSAQGIEFQIDVTADLVIERVEFLVDIDHEFRGDLEITITSPSGTPSVLAEPYSFFAPDFFYDEGLQDRTFLSVRMMDETTNGTWTIKVADRSPGDTGTLNAGQFTILSHAPFVAVNDEATTTPGTATTIDVLANDVSLRSPLVPGSVTITGQPPNGTVAVNAANGSVTYTPNAGFTGRDTFFYTVRNQAGQTSNQASVAVLVGTGPVANNDAFTTPEDTAADFDVLANDSGNFDPTTVHIQSQPTNGSAFANPVTGLVHYLPSPDFNGTDSFTYTVEDALGIESNVAVVTVTVTPVPDPPTAVDDSFTVPEDTPTLLDVLLNDISPDGTITSLVVTQQPQRGRAVFDPTTQQVLYTPDFNYFGPDSFEYRAGVPGSLSNVATVSITVTPQPDNPIAVDDALTILEDTPTNINVLANDRDGGNGFDRSSLRIITPPQRGVAQVNLSTGAVRYTPAANYFGADSFTYQLADTLGLLSNVATVNITIQSVNDPVNTISDFAHTDNGAPRINVLANDFDPDGSIDASSLEIVDLPLHGVAVVNGDRTITYTPSAGFVGGDGLHYRVKDNTGLWSPPGTVVIRSGPGVVVSGSVYVDLNNNGQRDGDEIGIAGTTVNLVKTNELGFSYSVQTDELGQYQFSESASVVFPAGTYDIRQVQPTIFVDGQETRGTPALGTIGPDQFVGLAIPSGGAVASYLFGERGIRPEFVGTVIGRTMFFASAAGQSELTGLSLAGGPVFVAFDAGLPEDFSAQLRFDASTGGARMDLLDRDLNVLAAATAEGDAVQLRSPPRPRTPVLLRLSGSTDNATLIVASGAPQDTTPPDPEADPLDVNGDGRVTPLDALLVINQLNNSTRPLTPQQSARLDTSGDGRITPLDALIVINELNRRPATLSALGNAEPSGAAQGAAADAALAQLADDELLGLADDPLAPAGKRKRV